MSAWPERQTEFARSVLADSGDSANELTSGLDVHRNTFRGSLVAALLDSFPVTAALVGAEFFGAMAVEFVKRSPPTSPVLIEYGHELPDFIRHFPPAETLPYLGDVAALESAWLKAYHAAEAAPIGVQELQGLDPEQLAQAHLQFHPSLQLLRFPYPIVSLWAAHREGSGLSTLVWEPENALIVRPAAAVAVYALSTARACFLEGLLQQLTISQAAMAGGDQVGLDPGNTSGDIPGHTLIELISLGAVTSLHP